MGLIREGFLALLRRMCGIVASVFYWIYHLTMAIFSKEAKTVELAIVGLQNAGKTTFVNLIAGGEYSEDTIPTVGFNCRRITVKKGNVHMNIWDLGGQPRLRSFWERYCRATSFIVFVADAADPGFLAMTKSELHDLLGKPSLCGIPLLVLGNKCDMPGALSEEAFSDMLGLGSVDRRHCCYMISCKNSTNISKVIDWLVK